MLINDLFDLFILERTGISEHTIASYKNHFRCISRLIDTNQELSKDVCLTLYLNVSKANVADATKATYLRIWKTFINWTGKDLPLPKIKNVETVKETYSDDEIKILTSRPAKLNFTNARGWAFSCFLAETGVRTSTLINIKREDVDFSNNSLLTRHNKNGKTQIACFGNASSVAIRYLEKFGKYEYLFTNEYGEQLSFTALESIVRRYNLSRGVSKTSIHLYRHYFAKSFFKNSSNVFLLQKLLGHSTLAMTEHYARIYNEDVIKNYVSPLTNLSRHKVTYKNRA